MSTTLTILDETVGAGPAEPVLTLDLLTSEISARDLVRRRIEEEARRQVAAGGRAVDAEAQIERATLAFEAQQLLLLVGDRQITCLDERIEIGVDTEVTFLRLLPLVGG